MITVLANYFSPMVQVISWFKILKLKFKGLRTHDVGGYNKGCPPKIPELKTLRFRRDLEVGMIVTNEPGCYFIKFILEKAFNDPTKAKYLNKEKVSLIFVNYYKIDIRIPRNRRSAT